MCHWEGHAVKLGKCQELNKKQGNANWSRVEQALPAPEQHPRGTELGDTPKTQPCSPQRAAFRWIPADHGIPTLLLLVLKAGRPDGAGPSGSSSSSHPTCLALLPESFQGAATTFKEANLNFNNADSSPLNRKHSLPGSKTPFLLL